MGLFVTSAVPIRGMRAHERPTIRVVEDVDVVRRISRAWGVVKGEMRGPSKLIIRRRKPRCQTLHDMNSFPQVLTFLTRLDRILECTRRILDDLFDVEKPRCQRLQGVPHQH